MTIHRFLISVAGALAMTASAWSQGRPYDKVIVDLPANVHVGKDKLAAGKYELRQMPSSGNGSKVILVTENGGHKYEASTTSISALQNVTPQKTQVILQRVGS